MNIEVCLTDDGTYVSLNMDQVEALEDLLELYMRMAHHAGFPYVEAVAIEKSNGEMVFSD